MDEILKRDQNFITVIGGITDDSSQLIRMIRVDPVTNRVLASVTGAGTGTVTSITQGTGILLSPSPITSTGSVSLTTAIQPIATLGSALQSIRVNAGATALEYYTPSVSSGTVTSVSVTTANGVSGVVATATTTPAITLTLGAITPTSVNGASSTEIGYLVGVTSAIQTQLNTKGAGTVTAVSIATANGFSGSSSGGATPALTIVAGAITPTTVNGNTITTGSGILTLGAGKTLTVSNTLTFTGTDSSSIAFGTGGTVLYNGGALGTPSSGTATNLTGTASGLTAGTVTTNANLTGAVTSSGNATSLGSFSSANLSSALTDETGSGVAVFNNKPTFLGTIQTITAVSALALDGSLGNMFTKTIGSPSTFTQSNFSTGQNFVFTITGAFTPTWWSGITWITVGAAAPTQGAITVYGFTCTGSNTFNGYLMATQ